VFVLSDHARRSPAAVAARARGSRGAHVTALGGLPPGRLPRPPWRAWRCRRGRWSPGDPRAGAGQGKRHLAGPHESPRPPAPKSMRDRVT